MLWDKARQALSSAYHWWRNWGSERKYLPSFHTVQDTRQDLKKVEPLNEMYNTLHDQPTAYLSGLSSRHPCALNSARHITVCPSELSDPYSSLKLLKGHLF